MRRKLLQLTSIGSVTKKLTTVDKIQMHTIARINALVLANMPAPIKHTPRFRIFKIVQYRNLHHSPSGKRPPFSPTMYPG